MCVCPVTMVSLKVTSLCVCVCVCVCPVTMVSLKVTSLCMGPLAISMSEKATTLCVFPSGGDELTGHEVGHLPRLLLRYLPLVDKSLSEQSPAFKSVIGVIV